MSEVETFEQRLKHTAASMGTLPPADSIKELKGLEKDITNYMLARKVEKDDRLSEMQIAVFNNLACLYEKRGKYRTSLYHLQIAEELENKYFTHKYEQQTIPLAALEKLSTTYSNLSAVQSKLGNYHEAILNAEFAVQILSKNEASKDHRSLIHLYYNYSFLLDVLGRYGDAGRFALEGLRLARLHADQLMIAKYEQLLETLKEKLARRENRKIKELKKHLKAELGVVKRRKEIEEKFLREAETIELEGLEVPGGERLASSNSNFASLKQYFAAQRKHLSKPTTSQHRERHNSTYTSLNTRKHQNPSLTSHPSKLSTIKHYPVYATVMEEPNRDIVKAELEEQKSNRVSLRPSNLSEYFGLTGKIRPNLSKTMQEGKQPGFRIKARKHKLEQQIEDLSRKNEVLAKIIEKIYSSEKYK